MIPIRDNVTSRRTPWITYALVGASVLAFVYELALGPTLEQFVRTWGVTPVFISHALAGDPRVPRGVLLTLVTALFLHGGWLHLGSNMLFLWVFGDNVEDRLGHIRYLFFYLVCGIGANLAQVYAMPNSHVPLIGASGAIAGILGAYLVMFPRARVTVLVPVFFIPLFLPVPAVLMLGVWFVTQLVYGVAALSHTAGAMGGVGWWAHIGGFVLGAALITVVPKARGAAPRSSIAPDAPRTLQRCSPLGALVMRGLVLVGEIISFIVTARIIVRVLELPTEGVLGLLTRAVYTISWPLVEPFTAFLPALSLGNTVLELYALLALFAYYVLFTFLGWAVGVVLCRRQPTY